MPNRYHALNNAAKSRVSTTTISTLTIGRVVDTNDPQQMGRVRAMCPALGDTQDAPIGDLPWALCVSPFAGVTSFGRKGVEQEKTTGPTAYGFWNIPKIGAQVLIGCVDGDTMLRFWIGCLQPQHMAHTMPHGRYIWDDPDVGAFTGGGSSNVPEGPLDSRENTIEPLYQNITTQFQRTDESLVSGTPLSPRKNMEWRTRGADTQVAAINGIIAESLEGPGSEIADHEPGDFEFTTITQEDGTDFVVFGPGYSVSQLEPTIRFPETTILNYDSQTYSWTTPGFHSIAMDDRSWNSRMRLRTTSGNQIILDDTNERIYVSTAEGRTWIELDRVGNIDIYADRNLSVRAKGDINFTTDQTFRVKAKQGIHMHSDSDARITGDQVHIDSTSTLRLSSDNNVDLVSTNNVNLQANNNLVGDSGNQTSFNAGGNFLVTGQQVHWNGPPATTLSLTTAKEAYWTSRVPEHEPWARVFMKSSVADLDENNSWEAEFNYTDAKVGRGSDERGEQYERNPLWHR